MKRGYTFLLCLILIAGYSQGQCTPIHPADTNCDCYITLPEVVSYIQLWKQGTGQMAVMMEGIRLWKTAESICPCADSDGDGYPALSCGGTDCDDNPAACGAACHPGATETCDSRDNDCDSQVDEGCACVSGSTRPCGTDIGECVAGTQTCSNGQWSTACTGSVGAAAEICDSRDNDCNAVTDNGILPQACALTAGVCAGKTTSCTNGVFPACTAANYGTDYEATETRCDAKDNDCDSQVDEGCACVSGSTRACGTDTGECVAGTQTCSNGQWSTACAGQVLPATEICDNRDNDCDGSIDESISQACSLSQGVCQGATQACSAGAWSACNYGQYY